MRAHTTATSATPPFVIHILVPSSTQSSPSWRALVRMPAGFDPKSGSVRPKQPMASPAAIAGSHCSRCSSVPYAWIAYMASEPCTDTSERMPESTASSSVQASPYATALVPAQPYPCRCMPSRPSEPSDLARSRAGSSPASYQSATWGRTSRSR